MSTFSTTSRGLGPDRRSAFRSGAVSLVDAGASGAGATGDLTGAVRRANQSSSQSGDAKINHVKRSRAWSVDPSRRAGRGGAKQRSSAKGALIRYASDNCIVRAIYLFTTGRLRLLFFALVIAVIGFELYFPARDLYASYRTGDIESKQLALRERYNKGLKSDVDKLLTNEGVEQAARDKLDLVMPGEKKINIVGRGDKKKDKGSVDPTQLDREERKISSSAPWYIRALDAVFCFKVEDDHSSSAAKR